MSFQEIKAKFQLSGVIEQLIYVNLAVYALSFIFGIFRVPFIDNWFSLPADLKTFIYRPWSIISYGFLHVGFIHLLSNLIGLYYFGHLFYTYFSRKTVLYFYFFGTIIGGLFFIIGYSFFPDLGYTPQLVGASAAVSALLIGVATYIPNYNMRFALIGDVKLKYIAIFWIGYSLLLITANSNLGGNLAHIGGGLLGYCYVRWFGNQEVKFNWFDGLFKKKSPLRKVYSSKTKNNSQKVDVINQEKVDVILDKIGKSGYNALSKAEKDFLFKQGK